MRYLTLWLHEHNTICAGLCTMMFVQLVTNICNTRLEELFSIPTSYIICSSLETVGADLK